MSDTPPSRFTVQLQPSGLRFAADADDSVLNAALAAGIRLPNSCRNGTCRTCLSRLLQGEIEYLIEWPGVSAEEKAEGYILPCVALPMSDLVIDAPGARRL